MNELERLPTWVQRSLAWGLLLLLLIVAWKLFDGYYLQRLQADIGQLQQELRKKQRVDAILARGKAVRALQERMAGQSVQALYLKQDGPSTAASALQKRIKALVESQSRARILTLKPYPAVEHEGFSEVAMEVRMKDLSHAGLQRILYGLESRTPLMVVKKINIKRTVQRYRPVVKPGKRDNQLTATLIVGAYFVPRGEGGG